MENRGIGLPDTQIPYSRQLYEQFQAEIEKDPSKREAIIWVAGLLRLKKSHALEILRERESHINIGNTGVMKCSVGTDNSPPSLGVQTRRETEVRPAVEAVMNTNTQSYAIKHQEAVKKSRAANNVSQKKAAASQGSTDFLQSLAKPSGSKLAEALSAPKEPTSVERLAYEQCVGDWKCKHCERWNKLFHEKCRSRDRETDRDCEGRRSWKYDVLCVQEDDGKHDHRSMGKHKGDWYCGECELWNFATRNRCRACTTMSDEAEYIMSNDAALKDAPPPPPSPERMSDAEKKKAFFNVNGRFITPRKKKW